jgi:hypothetical protein
MQFLVDIFQVLFHRLPGNSHLFCNLLIQQPFGKQFQHFFFPLAQQGISAPGNRFLKPLKQLVDFTQSAVLVFCAETIVLLNEIITIDVKTILSSLF